MPPKRNFDAELATLEGLRDLSPEAAEPELAKALNLRNNFLVSKAASVVLHHGLTGLTPSLVAAFPRFLDNAAKSDPQCWAKNALAKTLAAFEYQDPELFLTGMRQIQLEPVWGGSADTAGRLRGTCALALVQCRELNSHRVLTHLIPLFADKELSVRVNVVRAVVQVGTDSAALLLRLRAELASDEPEFLGSCYSGVLALEGPAETLTAPTSSPSPHQGCKTSRCTRSQTYGLVGPVPRRMRRSPQPRIKFYRMRLMVAHHRWPLRHAAAQTDTAPKICIRGP